MAKTKETDAAKAAATVVKAAPRPPPTPIEILHRNLALVDKYSDTRDALLLSRVWRYMGHLRVHLAASHLKAAIETYVHSDKARLLALLAAAVAARTPSGEAMAEEAKVGEGSEAAAAAPVAAAAKASGGGSSSSNSSSSSSSSREGAAAAAAATAAAAAAGSAAAAATAAAQHAAKVRLPRPGGASAPDLEAYLWIQVLSMVAAHRQWPSLLDGATFLLDTVLAAHNRRTLDAFQARASHYLALAAEALARGPRGAPVALRPRFLAAYRTACLRHDETGQATLINILLRSYLSHREVEAAAALLSKVKFPEAASGAHLVRFLFYTGRVRAVQLEYSEAHAALLQASRKAPPTAHAFHITVTAFLAVVQLLMGDIPERALFAIAPAALAPYMALTRATRAGSLPDFRAALATHAPALGAMGTLTLVRRLEANVIRTGLRRMASAYSRVTFGEVAGKLGLGSAEDAEFLCAKAVKDGVLDAVLSHEAGTLLCQPRGNVYATKEPQEAFHRRITFCLDVHNEAVTSMRYAPKALRTDLESAEAKRAREEEEEALLEMLEKGGEDDEEDY